MQAASHSVLPQRSAMQHAIFLHCYVSLAAHMLIELRVSLLSLWLKNKLDLKRQQNLCLCALKTESWLQQAAKQARQQSSDAGRPKEGPQPQHPGGGQVQRARGCQCYTQVISCIHTAHLTCIAFSLLPILAHCSRATAGALRLPNICTLSQQLAVPSFPAAM